MLNLNTLKMERSDMLRRTMKVALEVIKLTKSFPLSQESKVVTYQIIKSPTSTASNYRAAGRAKSFKDFIAKLGIAEEECDKTIFCSNLYRKPILLQKK
jgi:four helix bundle protein